MMTTQQRPLPTASVETRRPTIGELHEKAIRIAEAVFDGWSYNELESMNGDGEPAYSAVISGPDFSISLQHEYVGKADRLVAQSHVPWRLPDGSTFHAPYRFERAKASFAWTRGADVIAKELERKVVSNARALAGHWNEAALIRVASRKRHDAAVTTLAAAGAMVYPERNDMHQHFSISVEELRIDGEVSAGLLSKVALSCTPERLVQIVALLREVKS